MAKAPRRKQVGPTPQEREQDPRKRVTSPFVDSRPDQNALPQGRVLPDPSWLFNKPHDVMWKYLRHYKINLPWPDYVEQMSKYVERMSRIPPGNPLHEAELDNLLDLQSTRGLKGLARETHRRYQATRAQENKPDQKYIRITDTYEYDDGTLSTCDPCFGLAGEIGTLEFHDQLGFPGPASCDGGSLCNCQLIPVDF